MKRLLYITGCLLSSFAAWPQNITNIVSGQRISSGLFFSTIPSASAGTTSTNYDIVVYGGTSAGVTAAAQASRLGKNVAIICQNAHLGEMSSGGLGAADLGNFGTSSIGGLSAEFFTRVGGKYGGAAQYTFEPHVAEQVYKDLLTNGPGIVTVYYSQGLTGLTMTGSNIVTLTTSSNIIFTAREFLDMSFENDLTVAAGCSYTIGMEGTNAYNEPWAGVGSPVVISLDPYVTPATPSSGVIMGIVTNYTAGGVGNASPLPQAYNFRLTLSTLTANQIPFYAPTNYDPANYTIIARYIATNSSALTNLFFFQTLPNNKVDMNNAGLNSVSSDLLGLTYSSLNYLTNTPAGRAAIVTWWRDYTLGLMYFLTNNSSVPIGIRTNLMAYGYAKDEFTDSSNFPAQFPYVREGANLVGDYVMTQSNYWGQTVSPAGIGVAPYSADRHPVQRFLTNGIVYTQPGLFNASNNPAPWVLGYRSMTPKTNQCGNLLALNVSATKVAWSSIRTEPTEMILGQAAGAAAYFAISSNCPVQNVNTAVLRHYLFANGAVINQDITNGLQGWWRFTETSGTTTADSQSNNVGTLVNGPTFAFLPNSDATALSFSTASSQYVNVGANSALSIVPASPATWCAWINPNDLTAIYPIIAGTATGHAMFRINAGGLPRLIDEGSGGSIATSVGGVLAGVTTFVAVTWDGTSAIFFTNGVASSGTITPGGPGYSSGAVTIGGSASTSQYFNGFIGDARIYNRKLSAAEIFTLWLNHPQ